LSGETKAVWIGVGVGAGVTGLAAVLADHANTGPNSGAVVVAVVWVWAILVIAAVGVAVVRKYRRP
jgi:uncharacterized membrane protein YadS